MRKIWSIVFGLMFVANSVGAEVLLCDYSHCVKLLIRRIEREIKFIDENISFTNDKGEEISCTNKQDAKYCTDKNSSPANGWMFSRYPIYKTYELLDIYLRKESELYEVYKLLFGRYPRWFVQHEVFCIDGYVNGIVKAYYENGQLRRENYYKKGKREGISKLYYENGQLEEEINYKDGKKNGDHRKYFENGKLKEIGYWKDNKLDGILKSYYENGQLKQECNLKDGKLNGEMKTYYENGDLKYIKASKRKGR